MKCAPEADSEMLSGRQVGRRLFSERDCGKAFYDFFDMKNMIERTNGSLPLLWAVESVDCYAMTVSRFLEMDPVVFDIKDADEKASPRYVWTNIPDQNFKPDLNEIFESFSDETWALRDEPFLEKFPWIAHDLDAIRQPLPPNYFNRKEQLDRLRYRRETRSWTKLTDDQLNQRQLLHYSCIRLANLAESKRKSRLNAENQGWKIHEAGEDDDCRNEDRNSPLQFVNNQKYAEFLGFPSHFAQFLATLDEEPVTDRLNRTLPVTLWKHLLKPLQKLAKMKNC